MFMSSCRAFVAALCHDLQIIIIITIIITKIPFGMPTFSGL